MRYPKITFRPTQKMHEIIEKQKSLTGMSTSEVMRTIVSEYIMLVEKHQAEYR